MASSKELSLFGASAERDLASLRATGASALFEANIPEKIIQERTGHRSLKALRLYEPTTDEQHLEVSSILGKLGSSEPKDQLPTTYSQSIIVAGFQILVCLQLGTLSNCTININYGSNKVKIYHQSYDSDSSDDFDFPDEVKKQLLNMDF